MTVSAVVRPTLRAYRDRQPALSSQQLRGLYEEVCAHYQRCALDGVSLSDTWVQTLKHRGLHFTFEDMVRMLAPGNKVNFWIDDLHYLIDPTVIDGRDPVVGRILEHGESDFGAPRKDLVMGGKSFSSNFLHYVGYAARIAHAIEERGIEHPAILELGGGLGGLAYALRAYFGEGATLYLVDIPETLMLQEWYLRACFPEAATAFKATTEPVVFQRGGINFLNAYTLDSQPVGFDVVINTDSMQEMTIDTVQRYVDYFQKHISPRGFFYFQNHYGHSESSVPEPSEYPFDAHWTLRSVELASQADCCAESEQARFILFRTGEREDVETRRILLRFLWNGLITGQLVNSPTLMQDLASLPRTESSGSVVPAIGRLLKRHGLMVSQELLESLRTSIYAAHEPFITLFNPERVPSLDSKGFTQSHTVAVWRTQAGVLRLMHQAAGDPKAWSVGRLTNRLTAVCREHLISLEGTEASEYWSAYVASLLFVLSHRESATALLSACAGRSSNPFWLIRFACLLSRFHATSVSQDVMRKLLRYEPLDDYVALKYAELLWQYGDPAEAHRRLRALAVEDEWDLPRAITLAKVALRTEALDLALDVCDQIWQRAQESRLWTLLRIVNAVPSCVAQEPVRRRLQGWLDAERSRRGGPSSVAAGGMLLALGKREEGLDVMQRAIEGSADYYEVASVGKLLQAAQCDDAAEACLQRSIALRPRSSLHYDFVGSVYLSARRYAKAAEALRASVALRPYLRHVQAKALYCALPEGIRDSGVFGGPSDLALVFQRKQDFYHDLGLSNK